MRLLPMLLPLLTTTPALAETPAAPVKRVLLVWGGGRTAPEAEAAVKDYAERSGDWEKVLQLAEGYPRVLRAADAPGLKPGTHVAVLGVCELQEGARLAPIFDALEPRAESQEVTWPEQGAPPCPRLAEGWSFHGTALGRSRSGDLRVTGFRYHHTEGERQTRSWHLVLSASKGGRPLVARMELTGSEDAELQTLEAQGGTVRMVEREVDPACPGAETFQVVERTWAFSLAGPQISVERPEEKTLEEGPCAPAKPAPAKPQGSGSRKAPREA
jgi:hypothetical protein